MDGGVVGQGRQIELDQPAGHLGVDEQPPAALGQQRNEADPGRHQIEHRAPRLLGGPDGGPPRVRPLHQPGQATGEVVVIGPGQAGDGHGRQADLVEPQPTGVPQGQPDGRKMTVGIAERVDDGVVRGRPGLETEGVGRNVADALGPTGCIRRRGDGVGGDVSGQGPHDALVVETDTTAERREGADEGETGADRRCGPGRRGQRPAERVDRHRRPRRHRVPCRARRQVLLGGQDREAALVVRQEVDDGAGHGLGVGRVEGGERGGGHLGQGGGGRRQHGRAAGGGLEDR